MTLMAFCRDIEQIYDVSCRLEYGDDSISLKPQMATHIYYIAREAAYNAVKHGNAHNIILRLLNTGTTATLEIHDDGCGFSGDIEGRAWGSGLCIIVREGLVLHLISGLIAGAVPIYR